MPYQTACPECRSNGRDRSGDNLAVFEEGNTYCNACGYKGFVDEDGEEMDEPKKGFPLEEVEQFPFRTDVGRKVDESVCQTYGVRSSFDPHTGVLDKTYYPYYDSGGLITGYKVRDLTVDKKKAFSTMGSKSGMFGMNPNSKNHGNLMIVEGEEDCLAAKHMILQPLAAECDVVSLPNGAALDKQTTGCLDFIKQYKNVFICLDNDNVGKDATAKIAAWLVQSVVGSLRIVELDKAYGKDASDFLVNGHTDQFKRAIKASKEYQPLGIINGTDIDLDSLLETEPEGIPLPFYGLNKSLHGIRKAEIVMVCADSGIGKTTFSREIGKSLIEQGQGVAMIALEDQLEVTAKSLIALDMDIPLSTFRFRPPTKSECQPSYDKLIAGGSTFFYQHKGGLDSNQLLGTLTSYARSRTVDFIILDHIGVALAGTEGGKYTNEAKAIDILMNKLADLVKETGVGIIIVAHLKRSTDGVVHPEGREIKLTDLRGSAALEQYSFAVIGLERDQQADDSEDNNKVRVRLLKNRVFSVTGVVDRLVYEPSTGRLRNAPIPVPPVLDELEELVK